MSEVKAAYSIAQNSGYGDKSYVLIVPVVVVDGGLFEVELNPDTSGLDVREVDSGTLTWRREIKKVLIAHGLSLSVSLHLISL